MAVTGRRFPSRAGGWHVPHTLALLLMFCGAAIAAPSAPDTVDTIVVQGQKLTVESKIDRKIYTVPEDALSTEGNLSDILSAIPSVDIDPDGILSLRGDTHVLVLIDGKPATQLQGSKAGDNLQSMSALDIERIEVLTTPPAQYKADGAAGVINIITRKHTGQGAAGSVQASAGDGGRALLGANGNISGRHVTASVGATYRRDYRQRTTLSELSGTDPASGQNLTSTDHVSEHIQRQTPHLQAAAQYDPNERQSLSGSASWQERTGLRTYTQTDATALPSGDLTSASQRLSRGHDPENDYNALLRFTQRLDGHGQTLDLSVHRSLSHQREHYDYTNSGFVPPVPLSYDNLTFNEDQGLTEATLDYALPLSSSQSLKAGYAFEQDDYGFNNVGQNYDPTTGLNILNPLQSDDFQYRQVIHALYGSYQQNWHSWSVLGGLRTEYASTAAQLITTQSRSSTHYLRLYPSLHVDRVLTDSATLSAGYSRRVSRPDPSNLNPYVDYEYLPNLRAGNAALKPQYTQSFDLGYAYEAHGASYGLTGYYRRNRDSVTDVTQYLGGDVSITTKANLPKNDATGLEFSLAGRLGSRLNYSVSGEAFRAQIDGSALGYSGLRSTTGVNAKVKLDYHPSGRDSAQVTLTRTDKRLTPQGYVSAINVVNLGYKHSFSPALSATALVSDVFSGQWYRRTATTAMFAQSYERDVEGRIVFIGLSYALGVSRSDKGSNFDYDSGN